MGESKSTSKPSRDPGRGLLGAVPVSDPNFFARR